jgi:predicted transcriptional regulator
MGTMELNAELFRQLSIIAEDETLMRKAVKAIRKLAQEKEEEAEYISKEEVLAGIDAGLKDVKAGRTRPAREFLKELRDEL